MSEVADAVKISRLRSSLATKAAHIIKNKYIDEYQEVYYELLREHGLPPSTKVRHMQVLWEENRRLKEILKKHEWNYPKPKEQEDNDD